MVKKGLNEIIESFKNYTVIIVGDVMVDSYLLGNVTRISPEAPVPIVSCTKRENRLGGAANVAENVRSLGALPVICSVTGKDEKGQLFKNILSNSGLTGEGLIEAEDRPTTVKTRIISNNQQLLRVDQEIEEYLSARLEQLLIKKIISVAESRKVDAIIMQDYDKGVITPALIDKIIGYANRKGIPTFIDPKKRNFHAYKNATLFKPNFKELVNGLNMNINKGDFDAVFKAAGVLHKQNAFKLILITLSEMGILISDGTKYHVVPAEVRDVADVSGAGDTVIATAALGYLAGLMPRHIAALANLAGGIVCEKAGVVPIDIDLLKRDSAHVLK
jgi:rfaE bifunctional protein kinase chain/domain